MTETIAMKPDEFILGGVGVSNGPIAVRLARTPEEIISAQKLRYDIFYREYGAKPVGDMATTKIDHDKFDAAADHLIVIDRRIDDRHNRIIGTYRLIRDEAAKQIGQFYTADEFDISPIEQSGLNLVEVGRSCVHKDYRSRPVLQLLWQGIAEYITHHNIGLLFGCASFHGTDVSKHTDMFSYLHHFHMAPEDCRPRALEDLYIDMNLMDKDAINPKEALIKLPPLIKGYLRLGGFIGDGAIIDEQFNTTDVCVVVKTDQVSSRYKKHYERKTNASFDMGDASTNLTPTGIM